MEFTAGVDLGKRKSQCHPIFLLVHAVENVLNLAD
jgi:hypothetical protein